METDTAGLVLNSSYESKYEVPSNCKNVAEYILRNIREHSGGGGVENGGNGIADGFTGQKTEYKDFEKLAGNVAIALENYGFQNGDTLIYSTNDGAQIHAFLLGVWLAGGVLRSIYDEDIHPFLKKRMDESAARWILCDAHLVPEIKEICISSGYPHPVNIINLGESAVEGCFWINDFFHRNCSKGTPAPPVDVERSLKHTALILCTSGTTGPRKSLALTHEQLIGQIGSMQFSGLFNSNPKDNLSASEPLFLLSKPTAFIGSIDAFACIALGRSLIVSPGHLSDTLHLLEVVQKLRPTVIYGQPSSIVSMLSHKDVQTYDLASVRVLLMGELFNAALVDVFHQRLENLRTIVIIYGLNECGLMACTADVSLRNGKKSTYEFDSELKEWDKCPKYSSGKLMPGFQLKVMEPESDQPMPSPQENLGPGQIGELYFKSPFMCTEYMNNPEKTAETFTDDGWIRTGDLGYYDQCGFIFFLDRLIYTFKSLGKHVAPSEIERILYTHPAVHDCCVVGITDATDPGNKLPKAFVILKSGEGVVNKCSERELLDYTNAQLDENFKLLRGLIFVDTFPTAYVTGKVLRPELENITNSASAA